MAINEPQMRFPLKSSSGRQLNAAFCFNTTALRDFLRLSRATTDDSLSLQLNAMLMPSRRPFSTTADPSSRRSVRQIPGDSCRQFKNNILFPSWQDREIVLAYCEKIATVLDAEEDSAPFQQTPVVIRMPSDKTLHSPTLGKFQTCNMDPDANDETGRSQNYFGQAQVIDERTDPYSARDYSYARSSRVGLLREVLASEREVERIVRSRTWSLLEERCPDDDVGATDPTVRGYLSWGTEWKRWMDHQNTV